RGHALPGGGPPQAEWVDPARRLPGRGKVAVRERLPEHLGTFQEGTARRARQRRRGRRGGRAGAGHTGGAVVVLGNVVVTGVDVVVVAPGSVVVVVVVAPGVVGVVVAGLVGVVGVVVAVVALVVAVVGAEA